eukprot:g7245.t1
MRLPTRSFHPYSPPKWPARHGLSGSCGASTNHRPTPLELLLRTSTRETSRLARSRERTLARFTSGRSSQELGIRLATLKLDLSDRKTKRFFKEKERKSLLETLTPAIAEAKMQRFLAEQAQEGVPEATKMEELTLAADLASLAYDDEEMPVLE